MSIHQTAIIEDGAKIGKDVKIGAYSIIGPDVKIADHVTIAPHVVIQGDTQIGAGCKIYSFASLGSPPQDLKYAGEKTKLVIGENNTIREHVTMNPGTVGDNGLTQIGNNCLFMVGAHVAHDCMLGNNIIMANNATLGGHVHVGDSAIIGGLAAVHQFIRIGSHAIIGGMSGVESDVIPYGRVKGERAHLAGLNLIGLERHGFSKEEIRNLQRAYNQLFGEEGTMDQRIESVAQDFENDTVITGIVEFAQSKTKFPLCQPQKKAS